ncbi:MAG: heat-inducible transcription repressor HrcA [Limnochordales bacterium]|nr:heat-inducible transcription repressor HrcA [Limnochordales bacterium]
MLDLRKQQILQAVVEDYISTAEPVGSRTLARKYRLGLSPATIRNEMADLEDAGYLDQPHTSAGRVPSDKGYRYYVDCLLELQPPSPQERQRIEENLSYRREGTYVVQAAARLVAEFAPYAVLAVMPGLNRSRLRHLQLLPLDDHHLLLVMAADPGVIDTRMLELSTPLDRKERRRLVSLLNRDLAGLTLSDLDATIRQELRDELGPALYEQIMDQLHDVLSGSEPGKVLVEGLVNLLRQPEFQDVQKLTSLLEVLGRQDEWLIDLLRRRVRPGEIGVSIGRENEEEAIQSCALVTAGYEVRGEVVGMLAVVGPTRMEYGRVLGLMREVAEELSRVLDEL